MPEHVPSAEEKRLVSEISDLSAELHAVASSMRGPESVNLQAKICARIRPTQSELRDLRLREWPRYEICVKTLQDVEIAKSALFKAQISYEISNVLDAGSVGASLLIASAATVRRVRRTIAAVLPTAITSECLR